GIWNQLGGAYPELKNLKITLVPYSAVAGTGTGIDEMGDRVLAVFAVVTLLTVVIVCANVANLFLARLLTRQRELALRQSLGASRGRLIRMLVAEGAVISSLAAGAALLMAWWVARLAGVLVPPSEGPWAALARVDFRPDVTVVTYAIALAAVSVVAFTVAPAARTWRLELLPWLKAGEPTVVRGRSRLSSALVVIQLAFAVVLLTSAGLALRSLYLMSDVEPGFNAQNLLRVAVNTSGSASVSTHQSQLEAMRERLLQIPGVEAASYARLPLFRDGGWFTATLRKSSAPAESIQAQRNVVGPDFFRTLEVAVTGEGPSGSGRSGPTHLTVISQNTARALWPGEQAVGKSLTIDFGSSAPPAGGTPRLVRQTREAEVAGVVADGFFSGLRRQRPRFVFLDARQNAMLPGDVTFYVRYRGAMDAIIPVIRRSLHDVEPRTAVGSLAAMSSLVEAELWPMRTLSSLLLTFAALSLIIAAIGQYALVSFDMRRRFREVGLRMALGASARQVMRGVLGEGLRLTGIGVFVGFALSVATGRGLGGALYGVTPTDATTYLGVFAVLSAASLIACYLPAQRAATIHPMTALRQD
ncbi:MAG TPA: FtsX-like permease family protein, partial [Gemmatimonadaceae bacterium]|nr:FtsX-like permease family protein [Gemmatimonadaceae bacterium]